MTNPPSVGRRKLQSDVIAEGVKRLKGPQKIAALQVWLLGLISGFALSATAIIDTSLPDFIARPGAAISTVVLVVGLAYRAGGRTLVWFWLAAVFSAVTLIFPMQGLLAGAALLTAISGAVLAVLATRPASNIASAIKEYFVAIFIGLATMLAVGAWNAQVEHQLFNIIVVTSAVSLTFGIVWSLGANLHGLTPRYVAILLGAVGALIVLLAYATLVRSYGSAGLIAFLENTVVWIRTTIIGVPRPVQALLGFPALVVGVALRSQRRDGWWLMVFAAIGTSVMASAVVNPYAFPTYIGLSTLYSIIIGLGLGLIARHFVSSRGGSRASRSIEQLTRLEPKRTDPLK